MYFVWGLKESGTTRIKQSRTRVYFHFLRLKEYTLIKSKESLIDISAIIVEVLFFDLAGAK
jgi:hypothetical protein